MLQYERDESQAFSASYAAIVRRYAIDDTEALRMRALDRFASFAGSALHRSEVEFAQSLSAKGVLGRAASASYLPQSGSQAEAMQAEMREIFDRFQHDGKVEMAMVVHILSVDV